ncbi:MAG TPA: thiamine-phosphate kinase [Planctomycetes bacterium]|nr:thiamine-phosphate kinase [Planctomycetota bacterium]
MKEFALIKALRCMLPPPGPGVAVGVGDDAAVLAPRGRPLAVTTDTQIEGVHFRSEWLAPAGIGGRALEVALSDLAAMGARPRAVVVALQLPDTLPGRSALAIMRGLIARARARRCDVLGGNIAVCGGPLALTLTALGELPPGAKAALRSAARPGERIYATGLPGRARLGFEALSRKAPPAPFLRAAIRKYLAPRACIEEMAFLRARVRLGAAIDISDGLAGDLGHILEESGAGARILLPAPDDFTCACAALGLDAEACMLGPSDDYEILFTARERHVAPLATAFARRFGRPLVPIGLITQERGLWIADRAGRARRLVARSFEHGA